MSGGGIYTTQVVQGDGINSIGAACSQEDRKMSSFNLFCILRSKDMVRSILL